jgi:outer membrane protein
VNSSFIRTVAVALLLLPGLALAQGKIAVVDLQAAILQSDEAQKRLAEVRARRTTRPTRTSSTS